MNHFIHHGVGMKPHVDKQPVQNMLNAPPEPHVTIPHAAAHPTQAIKLALAVDINDASAMIRISNGCLTIYLPTHVVSYTNPAAPT